ncbi:MAG: tRNA dihydrouridine synthase DusB [Candidatus Marinimicrobia bacterium]|nr:tRNA dihydrouridine synthase DusB [Candidatus Neomarinimicrobiota bacterium]
MKIGNLQIPSKVFLAPMAGVTDHIYRVICREHSAGLVYTEFVSSNGVIRENERTLEMVHFEERERPIGIQIFGDDPDILAESAAYLTESFQPDVMDLNFGCPVPKVTKKGAGSAILKDEQKVREICEKVVQAVDIPVTVKMRSGWSDKDIVAPRYAQIMEAAGIKAVAVHGRTTKIRYEEPAELSVIAETKDAVSIPVIGNGDIFAPEDAKHMMDETGCDGVMIARGALGNPWILERTHHYLETGGLLPEPSFEDRLKLCVRHIQLKEEDKDSTLAAMLMKKNIGWYLKGMPGVSEIRQAINTSDTTQEMYQILQNYGRELEIEIDIPTAEIDYQKSA